MNRLKRSQALKSLHVHLTLEIEGHLCHSETCVCLEETETGLAGPVSAKTPRQLHGKPRPSECLPITRKTD